MAIGSFRLGGSVYDPFPVADGWSLLLQFDTNSPSTTTFDPTITATSGQYGWDLGDGTIIYWDKVISHTYTDSSTKAVKLYGKGTCTITQIDFNTDNIVGGLDSSNTAFASVTTYGLYSNSSMTGLTFASSITGTIITLNLYSTGITGTLDLSMFTTFSATTTINVNSNSSLTGVTFASSITGTILSLQIYSSGITGTLDLSMFTTFSATGNLDVHSNSSMTGLTLPTLASGYIKTLFLNECTSLGYVNTTGLNTAINNLDWRFQGCGWSAAIVNQVLVDIDGISAGGYTGRVINIGGTNADPDSSSGGYDGSAAKTSLEGKGFTVTIT